MRAPKLSKPAWAILSLGALVVMVLLSRPAIGSHVVASGRLWTYSAGSNSLVHVWDLETDSLRDNVRPPTGKRKRNSFRPYRRDNLDQHGARFGL